MQGVNSKVVNKDTSKSSQSTWEGKNMVHFVGEVKQELKRVEWTNKDELKAYTKIVLVSIFLFGAGIYLIDLLIQGTLGGINLLLRTIIG